MPNTYPSGLALSADPHGYVYETSGGNSNYNAFSAQLQRRFHGGFLGNALYVYSKAIDDGEGGLGGRNGGGVTSYAQNWLDLTADRGPSLGQRNQTFTLSMQYSTAMGARGGALMSGWKSVLAKNWNFSSSLSLGSGQPLTPTVANSVVAGTGFSGVLRPDYIGGSLAPVRPGYGFNAAVFADPGTDAWGNAGRGIIMGPGSVRVQRLGRPRVPPQRTAQHRPAIRRHQPAEPRGLHQLEHHAGQHAVRSADQRRRYAQFSSHSEVQVLICDR